jgi:uncharacterized protein (TIGR03435 family)
MRTAMRVGVAVAIGLCSQRMIRAQDADPQTFSVVSVKPSPSPPADRPYTVRPGVITPGDRWQVTFSPIYIFLRFIYGMYSGPGQIIGAPDWTRRENYDIDARADGNVTREQMMIMIRNLMKDRFKLAVHTERRELTTYVLVLARSDGRLGPGLRVPAVDCSGMAAARARGETPATPPTPPGFQAPCDRRLGRRESLAYITAAQTRIAGLAGMLENTLGGPVVDRTGLRETFDIVLEFAPPTLSADPNANSAGPSIFAAVQDQLGLKLVQEKVPADVLVIDHIERPTAN